MSVDVDNSWVFSLETTIFTKIKSEGLKLLKDKYPKINFTTSSVNMGSPIFPTVYVHELAGREIGQDLTNKTINAVVESLQVEVITDTSQSDCKYIASVIGSLFKSLSFSVDSFPSFENGSSYYRTVMRVSRTFGQADTF